MSSHFLVYLLAVIAWQGFSGNMENGNKQPQIFLSLSECSCMQMVLTNSTPGDLSMFDEVRELEKSC